MQGLRGGGSLVPDLLRPEASEARLFRDELMRPRRVARIGIHHHEALNLQQDETVAYTLLIIAMVPMLTSLLGELYWLDHSSPYICPSSSGGFNLCANIMIIALVDVTNRSGF